MYNQIQLQIQNIQLKLQQLLKEHQLVQKENIKLKNDIEKSNQLIQSQKEELDNLHRQVDVLKLGYSNSSKEDKKELEKRIDGYLKEIEKCISLLNAE